MKRFGLEAIKLACVTVMMLTLAACFNTRGGTVAYNPAGFTRPDTENALVSTATYQVNPYDVLTVNIFQIPNLSGDYTVDNAGNLSMPLIGNVSVKGQTVDQVAKILTARYGEKYLSRPQIQVIAKTINPMTITVEGSVNRPGIYPIKGPTTLIQAVALASGTSELANPKRVVVFRQIMGKREAAAFDLQSVRRDEMIDPQIYGNDIIVVDGADSKSTFRDMVRVIPLLGLFSAI